MFSSYTSVLTNSNWFAVLIFLFVYCIVTTTYCFLMSILFTKANTAAAVSGLMWFITQIPYMYLTLSYVEIPFGAQVFASFLPNVAMSYGFRVILDYEGNGEGLQFSNYWGNSSNNNQITVGATIFCMLGMAIFFLLLTLYIEKVWPGEYGVPEEWDFLFTKEFWCGKKEDNNSNDLKESQTSDKNLNDNFESEPTDCELAIKVKNLRKEFEYKKVVCKNITFNIFYNQITAFLGHNGAGKSTTIKILTGFIPPTSGTAIIHGFNIRTDRDKASRLIGFCPQNNILFDELTVSEHIELFSRLKGVKKDYIQDEVNKYTRLLSLEEKKDSPSYSLSGGMQRKLSFGGLFYFSCIRITRLL